MYKAYQINLTRTPEMCYNMLNALAHVNGQIISLRHTYEDFIVRVKIPEGFEWEFINMGAVELGEQLML